MNIGTLLLITFIAVIVFCYVKCDKRDRNINMVGGMDSSLFNENNEYNQELFENMNNVDNADNADNADMADYEENYGNAARDYDYDYAEY